MKPRLVSGIKPTGSLHIGNYFGVMRQMLELQDRYGAYIFIADLHAFNQLQNPTLLRSNILDCLAAYLAIGLDPTKVVLFQQSAVPQHAELNVILNAITSMGLLERSHAYKDALANGKPSNVGLFDYPVLMAADILLYDPEVVPVGRDQQQHLEITADLAGRFNHLFGPQFRIPKALIRDDVATILGTDGRKMSKSYNNTIGLFEPEDSLRKKVMSITTDSKRPEEPKDPATDNLFALHRLVSQTELPELRHRYEQGEIGYKESKEILFENLNKMIEPLRQRYNALRTDEAALKMLLEQGNVQARILAATTLDSVKQRIGML